MNSFIIWTPKRGRKCSFLFGAPCRICYPLRLSSPGAFSPVDAHCQPLWRVAVIPLRRIISWSSDVNILQALLTCWTVDLFGSFCNYCQCWPDLTNVLLTQLGQWCYLWNEFLVEKYWQREISIKIGLSCSVRYNQRVPFFGSPSTVFTSEPLNNKNVNWYYWCLLNIYIYSIYIVFYKDV